MRFHYRRCYTNQTKVLFEALEYHLKQFEFGTVEKIEARRISDVGAGEWLLIFTTHDEKVQLKKDAAGKLQGGYIS